MTCHPPATVPAIGNQQASRHEAGHAVFLCAVGHPPVRVEAYDDRGATVHRIPRTNAVIEAGLVAAGRVGEYLLNGGDDAAARTGLAGDVEQLYVRAIEAGIPERTCARVVKALFDVGALIAMTVLSPRLAALRAVADRLRHERVLSGIDVLEIVNLHPPTQE